jgi:hypothetical protein
MKKKAQIFIAISILMAIVAFELAVRLSPWFYAVNTRVRLRMEAPADTAINICWDDEQIECLPLVPYSEASKTLAKSGEIAHVWLGELPPRPVYHVSLAFVSGVRDAVFYELELDSSTTQILGVLSGAGIRDTQADASQFKRRGVSYKFQDGDYQIESDPGGKLVLIAEIQPTLSDTDKIGMATIKVWILLCSIFLLFFIPLIFVLRIVEHLGHASNYIHLTKYPWWVYLLSCAVLVFVLILTANSTVLINPADPIGYIMLATGGEWFNEQRLPGYPLFLGLALWVSGNSLTGVILFQVTLLVFSTILCIWILQRWLHPLVAILFVLFCVLSPTQVHYARWITRESLFTSLVLFGVTAFFAHHKSRKPYSEIWFVIFAIICAVTFLVRENGILLLIAMAPALAAETIKRFISPVKIQERMRSIFLLCLRYSIPVLAVGIVYIGFAVYNYIHYGYFQLESTQKSHHYLARTIFASNFDSRSLLYPSPSMSEEARTYLGWPLYSSYILSRDQAPISDPIHASLFQSVIQKEGQLGLVRNLFHSASILDEIGKSANSLVPWQADFAGGLRHYWTLVFSKDAGYSLMPDNPALLVKKREWLGMISNSIKYEEKPIEPPEIVTRYYKISRGYPWYRLLVILALISSIYILWYEDVIFLAPITLFLANGLLLVFTRLTDARYISILDVLLIMQIAFGLSFWIYRRSQSIRKTG